MTFPAGPILPTSAPHREHRTPSAVYGASANGDGEQVGSAGNIIEFRFASCTFIADPATQYAVTQFHDGTSVPACPHDTDEYRQCARDLGYGDNTWLMCVHHELFHTILALADGQDYSPTLWAVAHGRDGSRTEESRVIEFQRKLMGLVADRQSPNS